MNIYIYLYINIYIIKYNNNKTILNCNHFITFKET